MSDVQAWLDQATARLEERTPTDLTKALAALQAVLDMHQKNIYGTCASCVQNRYPCPTVRAIRDALGDD